MASTVVVPLLVLSQASSQAHHDGVTHKPQVLDNNFLDYFNAE